MSFDFFPRGTEPTPFDVVWCRFPYDEAPHLPAPDDHPALVKRTHEDEDGNPWITVVFGTSQKVNIGELASFRIPDAELRSLGLTKPTKLCLWRESTIPYSKDFFPLLRGRSYPTAYPMSEDLKREFQTHAAHYQHSLTQRGASSRPKSGLPAKT